MTDDFEEVELDNIGVGLKCEDNFNSISFRISMIIIIGLLLGLDINSRSKIMYQILDVALTLAVINYNL